MSRNKRYIKEKSGKNIKRTLILIVLLAWMVIPELILSIPNNNIKANFFAYTMVYSCLTVVLFLLGFFFVFTSKKDVKLRAITFGTISLVGSILLSIMTLNYYKDVPKIINSNYSFYKGNLTNVKNNNFRNSVSTILTINNQKFEIHGALSPEFTIIGKEYYVTFLPNSKFVIDLKTNKVNPTNAILRQNLDKYNTIHPLK